MKAARKVAHAVVGRRIEVDSASQAVAGLISEHNAAAATATAPVEQRLRRRKEPMVAARMTRGE